MTSVSVVIPSWNSLELLRSCLASLDDVAPGTEVVVVDNGSSDGTVDWLEQEVPAVRVVANERNRGFAVAMNQGVATASGEHVLLLNVDCVVRGAALELLGRALDDDRGLAAVQPMVLQAGPGPSRIYSAGQVLRPDGRAYEAAVGDELDRRRPPSADIFGVCGAACMFRRSAFVALGGFQERFFAFHEDVELNARARLAGWRFALVAEAEVTHIGNAVWQAAAGRPSAFNARLVARNRLATDIELLPARYLPGAAVAELASVLLAVRRGTGASTVRGKLEALAWLPWLLTARRALGVRANAASLQPYLRRAKGRRLERVAPAAPTDA